MFGIAKPKYTRDTSYIAYRAIVNRKVTSKQPLPAIKEKC